MPAAPAGLQEPLTATADCQMYPTIENIHLLSGVTALVCFVWSALIAGYQRNWKPAFITLCLLTIFLVAVIPEPTDAVYSENIDLRLSFLAMKLWAYFTMFFSVLAGFTVGGWLGRNK